MLSARRTALLFFFVTALIFTAATALHSVELSVNGYVHSHYNPGKMDPEAYRIPLPEGGYALGHSLAELLPLFTSAYRMDITYRKESGEHTTATLQRDSLGDLLFESALVSSAGNSDQQSYRLIVGDKSYPDTLSVDVYGYPVESGSLTIWLSWEGVDELKRELRHFAETHQVELKLVQVPNTDTKLTATLRGGGELPDLVMIQSSSLADLINSDGSITVDNSATADTINYIMKLSDRGLLEISERDAMTGYFASGKTAISTRSASQNSRDTPITWRAPAPTPPPQEPPTPTPTAGSS